MIKIIRENKVDRIFFEKINEISKKGEDLGLIDKEKVEDYREHLPDKLGEKLLKGSIVIQGVGRSSYNFTYLYEDRTGTNSSVVHYRMRYSLRDRQEDQDYSTEVNLYRFRACQCCDKEEVKVVFPEAEDINHYIIVSELNEIDRQLSRLLDKSKKS